MNGHYDNLQRVIAEHERFASAVRRRLGLTPTEHRVVQQLTAVGAMTSAELSRRVGITTASMTSVVRRLDDRGLIRRVDDATDRRQVLIYPTRQAIASDAAERTALAADIDRALAELGTRERIVVDRGLTGIEAALRQQADQLSRR